MEYRIKISIVDEKEVYKIQVKRSFLFVIKWWSEYFKEVIIWDDVFFRYYSFSDLTSAKLTLRRLQLEENSVRYIY